MSRTTHQAKALLFSFYRTGVRSGRFVGLALLSVGVYILLLRQHQLALSSFCLDPSFILLSALVSVVLGPSLLKQDSESRRLLLWKTCGLSSEMHYVARLTYLLTQILLFQVVPFFIAGLTLTHNKIDFLNLCWFAGALLIAQLQASSFVTFLSVFAKAYWNSAFAVIEMALAAYLALHYHPELVRFLGSTRLRFATLILVSPMIIGRDALYDHVRFRDEAIVSFSVSMLLSTIGVWFWKRKELGLDRSSF